MKLRNLFIPTFTFIGFIVINSSAFAQSFSIEKNIEKVPDNRLIDRLKSTPDSFKRFHKPNNNTVTSRKGDDINSRLYAVSFNMYEEGAFTPIDSLRLFWNADNYDPTLPIFYVNEFLYYPDNSPKMPTAENFYIVKTDSLNYYSWDSESDLLQMDSKVIMSFNDQGNVNSETEMFSTDGINWQNYWRSLFTYNSDGNPDSETEQEWTGSAWQNFLKRENTYDSQNNILEVIRYDWESGANSWDKTHKSIFTYNDLNKINSFSIMNWNNTDNSWQNNTRFSILYDGNNLIQILQEGWSSLGLQWEALEKTDRTYNGNNQLTTSKSVFWNQGNQVWINSKQFILDYDDDGNNISRIQQDGQSGLWNNSFKEEYFYSSLNLVEVIGYVWNVSQFTEDARILYSYNDYQQCTEAILDLWDGNDWASEFNSLQIRLYYEEFEDNTTGIAKITDQNEFEIFPNPASDILNIKSNNQEIQQIRIIDVAGKTVFESSTGFYASEINVPVNQLRNGVFIIQVTSGNQTGTKSFVVRH